MRFAARVLLPGTGWIAFMQLMDLVGLMTDLLGNRCLFDVCQGDPWPCYTSIPLGQFVTQPSHLGAEGQPSLTLNLRTLCAVFVMVRATDLIERLMFSVARLAARSS